MLKTTYSDEEIEEFRNKYKYYRWIYYLLSIMWLIFSLIRNNTDHIGTYSYFNNGFHYINRILYFILIITQILFIFIYFIYDYFIKIKLKDKYIEYEVSFRNKNIKQYKWTKYVNFILIILTFALFVFVPYFAYNSMTHITVRDDDIYINYHKYGDKLSGSFSYDYFTNWNTSNYDLSIALYLTDKNGEKYYIELGKSSNHLDTLFQLMDEKTDFKYHLYEDSKTEHKSTNSLIE